MAKGKFKFKGIMDRDVAKDYIHSRLQKDSFYFGGEGVAEAYYSANSVEAWINEYMTPEDRRRLAGAVRAARKRYEDSERGKEKKSVTLSQKAHLILADLAKAEGITISEAVVLLHKKAEGHTPY